MSYKTTLLYVPGEQLVEGANLLHVNIQTDTIQQQQHIVQVAAGLVSVIHVEIPCILSWYLQYYSQYERVAENRRSRR